METIILAFGVALVVVLLYLALTGGAIPPALKIVVIVAVAIILLACVMHQAGCELGGMVPRPTPQ